MQKRDILSMTCRSFRTTRGAMAALALAMVASASQAQAQQLWSKTISLTSAEASQYAPPPRDAAAFEAEMAREVLSASNQARARQGLSSLQTDPALDSIAAAYSRRMLNESFFGHVAPDGSNLNRRLANDMQRLGRAAENLWTARGKIDWRAPGVSQQTVENWLDSPGHRRNLLDGDFSTAGVGVAQRGDAIYVTMLYGAPQTAGGSALVASLNRPASAPAGFGASFEASALRAINGVRARNGLSPLSADGRLVGIARARSQELGRNGGLSADGGLLDQASASTGARRVAATVWKGDNVEWSAEKLAEMMLQTWQRDSNNMQALLDGSYASVGLGVEVVDGGVRLAAVFTDAAGGGTSFGASPAAFEPAPVQMAYAAAPAAPVYQAASIATPVYNPAPVQMAFAAPLTSPAPRSAPVHNPGGFPEIQTGSIGLTAAPSTQFASVSGPVYEPGDAVAMMASAPVYDPAPAAIQVAYTAPRTSPTPRSAPLYDPSPIQVAAERLLESPVLVADNHRGGWSSRRVTTFVTVQRAADAAVGFSLN